MNSDRQRLARAVLQRLVTPEQTRAIVTTAELAELAPTDADRDAVEEVIEQLAEARLLAIESGGESSAAADVAVEIIHESLITRWPTLRRWLDENQEDTEFVTRVRTASQQWQRAGRSEDLLWRGQAAEDARRWLARHGTQSGDEARASDTRALQLGAAERRYLRAVEALAVRAKRQRLRLAIAAFGLLAAVAVVVSVLALDARSEASRADSQALEAEQKAELARAESLRARNAGRIAAAREQQDDPTLALTLVREIESAPQLPSRWKALARWAMHQGVALTVLSHRDVVTSAAFSPDGTRIVTALKDKTARVHSADGSAELLVLRGHQDEVNSASFSRDGTRIVTASSDNTARVWNADGSGEPLVLRGHRDRVNSAAFSRDGTRIVTASKDKTARV
ncbi:MAG: protein kinase, partial [Myxococcota bacterium]